MNLTTNNFKISDYPISITPFKPVKPNQSNGFLSESMKLMPKKTTIEVVDIENLKEEPKPKSARLLKKYFHARPSSQGLKSSSKKRKVKFRSHRKLLENKVDPTVVKDVKQKYKKEQILQFKKFMAYMSKIKPNLKTNELFRNQIQFTKGSPD
jgi:hypothetical protein